MPDLIKMKTGAIANLEHETNSQPDIALDRGSIYFAVDTTNHIGKIVYDAPVGTNGVDRIVMSTQAEYADEATLAGNVSGVVAIANGGTGGTTVSAARANLGLGNGKIFIGTCSTAAATVAKEVACAEFTANDLIKGSIVLVSFSETNSGAVANLTLNVNNTGAKNIKKYYNSGINNLTAKGELIADSIIPFVYNGTYWVAFGLDYNNTYSTMSQAEADTGTATSGRVISAKVLSDTIANNISNSLSSINAMIYKGTISSSSSLPAIHEAGWTYKITTAGTYVGENCEVGDLIICIADGTAANDNDWTIIQKNIDKGLFKSSNTFTNGDMLLADGTDGKVKSIAINPTLTLTAGTSSTAPKLKIAVGGINSDESTINTATTGLYGVTKLSNTSSSNEEGLAATPKGVWNAINTLDGVLTGTPGASKTLTAFEQTNGKVSATFSNIAISAGQITSGTLPVAAGGTGLTTASYKNAVVIGNSTTVTDAMQTIRTASGAFYATAQDGKPQFGTLPVAQGGTGATSFTVNSIVMSGSTTTAALTTRAVTNNTSNTAIANNTNIPTMNTIYYGLVTVNGASQTRATDIYTPTGAGTAGQILVSTGSTTKIPAWKTLDSHTYTPAGTVSQPTFTGNSLTSTGKFTPAGTVTRSTDVAVNTTTVNSITAVGTLPSLTVTSTSVVTGGTTTAIPNISKKTVVTGVTKKTVVTDATFSNVVTNASVTNEILTIAFGAAGSATTGDSVTVTTGDSVTVGTAINAYTTLTTSNIGSASDWDAGDLPTKGSNTTVATGIKTQPAFTFGGTEGNLSVTGTPGGTVSQPTFTGTDATLTHTVS